LQGKVHHRYQRHQGANFPLVSTTPTVNLSTIFASVVDIGGKFATEVNDTGINDTGGKFATGVVNTGGKQ
jgi:hypothetical protein